MALLNFSKDKRGQFFSAYLVLLTLFMCGFVLMIYYFQAKAVGSELVSPAYVLEIVDEKEIFELQERAFVKDVYEEFYKDNVFDEEKFKEEFCEKFSRKDFVVWFFKDLKNDKAFSTDLAKKSFCKDIYGFEFLENGRKLSYSREEVEKEKRLVAFERRNRIDFPVDFVYSFGREDLINSDEFD